MAGCSGEPSRDVPAQDGLWLPGERWRLVEDLRIGRLGGGPDAWGSVGDVVADPSGRLFIADNQAREIRVFTSDGEPVRTFGQGGEGPGEIASVAALHLSPAGRIWVHDPRNQRFTVFDTTGTFVRDWPIRSATFLQGHRFGSDGTFLELTAPVGRARARAVLVRHQVGADGALEPGDTFPVPVLPASETRMIRIPQGVSEAIVAAPIPFTPRPRRIIDARATVWTTATDGSYRLTQHSLTGDTLATLERDARPVPVAEADRLAALEPFQGTGLDGNRVPMVHPPYEDVDVSDDGHLWVWRHATPSRMAWDVFDPSGRYLGAVDSPYRPGEFVLRSVLPDALLGVWTDETGLEHVVRLRIVKG